jgi:hypothetical protein
MNIHAGYPAITVPAPAVTPAERYLAYLSALDRSPNTVRTRGQPGLRLDFLRRGGAGWAEVGTEDVARFDGRGWNGGYALPR